jgi:argininosuccinate lyase
MSRFHKVYVESVLLPDYRFARQHLARHFLDAMTAHVMTVGKLYPDRREVERLLDALGALRSEPFPEYAEDVPDLYFAFNRRLEAELGEGPVSFLRLGLSRNDLDMTVYKMRTRELLLGVLERLGALRGALLAQAEAHVETVLIAQTHHQPGQPTTVAHYLSAIGNALARDAERLFECYGRLDTCPLGAAALAGSSHALDRHYTAALLGFGAPVSNTYDAVASADWQVEFVTRLQNLALTLSRFVHDLLHWAADGLYVLGDGLVQGSSIMPQKRNPVALEHARTRFSRTLGSSQMVLYSSHNIPYADLNDFGPDIQGALVSLYIQLEGGLTLTTACLEDGHFDTAKLARQAACTDTTATELADELTRHHGLSFQAAHHLAAALVQRLCQAGKALRDATPEDVLALGGPALSADALASALDPAAFVARRDGFGGPAPARVREHLAAARQALSADLDRLAGLHHKLAGTRDALAGPRKEHV